MASAARPPTGATKVVGGISFDDPFDWLHPDTAESLDWQDRRSAAARDHARSIVGFEQLRLTIEKIMRGTSALAVLPLAPRRRGGRWFRLASDLSSISVAGGLDDPGRVVVDASRLSAVYGEPARLWFPFEPSPDGRKLLVGVSRGGAMIGDVRVLDVDSGHLFDLTVDAELANQPLPGWFPDNDRFLIAERGADQRHQIRSCEVSSGTSEIVHMIPDGDVPAGSPALSLQVSPGGRFAVAVTGPHEHTAVQIGDLATGRWRRLLPDEWQGECYGTWLDEDIYLAIVADISPRGRLVAIPAATSSDTRTWTELVAPSDAVLKTITIVDDTIVLAEILDVAANLRLFNRFGVPKGPVRLPAQGSTNLEFPPRILPDNDAFTFAFSTFNQPPTIYQLEPHTAQLQAIGAAPHPLEHVEFSRHFVPSCDGTRIPYFVVRRADLGMSEPHPTLIHAYGGFNVALLPTFLGGLVPFVDAGGIYVHACPRGGAEYGKEWADGGRLHTKQRTFDDVIAVAEQLIRDGITVPDKLAFYGASNGGLTAGVMAVQRPDLWRVVVAGVPLLDLMEPWQPGQLDAVIRPYILEDYGDPDDPEMAKVIHGYSPYHNVTAGTPYPTIVTFSGTMDVGCEPFHARRFCARVAAATTSGRPVLMRVWEGIGHGSVDPAEAAAIQAEWLAVVMDELGLKLPR